MQPCEPRDERGHRPGSTATHAAAVFAAFGVLALVGALYVTAVNASYLLVHARAMAAPDATHETLVRLQLEIAAESIKLFLDLYLVVVAVLLVAPSSDLCSRDPAVTVGGAVGVGPRQEIEIVSR